MSFTFTNEDFERISAVLGTEVRREGSSARYRLKDEASGRAITLEITCGLTTPESMQREEIDNLVTVMTSNSLLQLQGCTGFIESKELGEVIFFARSGGVTNGLVVEREAGCSLYANFDNRLLSTDFTQLAPELIMSAVALSLTAELFNDLS